MPLSMVTRGKNLLRITFSISLGLLAAALFFAVVASLNDHLENFWVNVVQMFGLGLVVSAFAFLPPLLVGSVALTWVPKRPLGLALSLLLFVIVTTAFSRWVFIYLDVIDKTSGFLVTLPISFGAVAVTLLPLLLSPGLGRRSHSS